MRKILLLIFLTAPAFASNLRAGHGMTDITPKLCEGKSVNPLLPPYDRKRGCFRWIHLGGFSPYYTALDKDARLAQGVESPIWSRAIYLTGRNDEKLLMISVDLPGLAWKHINPIKRRISENFGIPVSNIIIHSTHVHSAPDAAGYWSTFLWAHNKDYTDLLRDWIYLSAREALSNNELVNMKVVTTTHYSCINPKTLELKRDPDCRMPDLEHDLDENDGTHYDNFVIQRDMRDPVVRNTRIVAAQFISRHSGKTLVTFLNWSQHPELLESKNRLISSDFSHYLRQYVEHELGGRAIYFVGTLGNQIGGLRNTPVPFWNEKYERQYQPGVFDIHGNPVPVFVGEGNVDKIRSTGYEIGFEAVKALRASEEFQTTVDIKIKTESIDNPVDNFVHKLLTWSVWGWNVDWADRMRRYFTNCSGLLGCVRSDLHVVQIGDLGFVTAPGEVDPAYFYGRHESIADYGGKWGKWKFPAMPSLEKYIPGKHKTMIGSADNYLSYLVPESDNVGWNNDKHPNHYEELVTIGKFFGDDTGNKLMEMLGSTERFSKRPVQKIKH